MTTRPAAPTIRPARLDELESLLALQQASLRRFGMDRYPTATLEAALAQMGTMDPRMISDGTYLAAERDGALLGCAGWTARPLPYARLLLGPMPPLPPDCGMPGTVRSLYVAPHATGLGVGAALLAAVEARLLDAGADTAEMLVAVSGEGFFARHGYVALSDHAFRLADGIDFAVRRMARLIRPPVMPHRGAGAAPCRPAAAAG
jgi:GNAT superfamily N-acetyltransferase